MFGNEEYSRRHLLYASGGIGLVGFATGASTAAYLSDSIRFSENHLGTGSFALELAVAIDDDHHGSFPSEEDFTTATLVPISISDIEPEDNGVVRIAARLCESSGSLWWRPEIGADGHSELARSLHVSLAYRTDPSAWDRHKLFDGAAADLASAYPNGESLDQPDCLGCDPVCFDLEWYLDSQENSDVLGESFDLTLEFAAVQCRHYETTENPWT